MKEPLCQDPNSIDHQKNLSENVESVNSNTITETKKDLTNNVSNDTTNPNSGIYKIINKLNGKYYVGSSKALSRRWVEHKRMLNQNKHYCAHLQRAWNKYNPDSFEFHIIQLTSPDNRVLEEQKELDRASKDLLYNTSYIAAGPTTWKSKFGKEHPLFGKKKSLETRERNRQANLGSKNPNFGTTRSESFKQMVSNLFSDKSTYTFKNLITNDIFIGSRVNFSKYTGLTSKAIYKLIKFKNKKTASGWTLTNSLASI